MEAFETMVIAVLNEGENVIFLNTKDVAKLLGVSTSRLSRAIWSGRVDEPQKGPGNAFFWTPQDIDRASWQLLGKPYQGS